VAFDYEALIEDLETKRRQFNERTDVMIAHARTMMAMEQSADAFTSIQSSSPPSPVVSSAEIPRTAFMGMKLQPAVLAYLAAVQKKCTTADIKDGVTRGGLHTASRDLYSNVHTALSRLEQAGEVVKFGKEWGLAAWYPGYRGKKRDIGSEKQHPKPARTEADGSGSGDDHTESKAGLGPDAV